MDTVSIHELRIETLIGFYEWERRLPQTIQLDMEFALPTSAAGRSDRLRDTNPAHGSLDVAFKLEENVWNGRTSLQARLVDLRPAL